MFFNNMFASNTATTSNTDEKFALGVALLVECGRLLCFVIFYSDRLVLVVHVPSVACVIAARALELFGESRFSRRCESGPTKYTPQSQGPLAVAPPHPPPPTRRCENAADISALEVERNIMRQQRPSAPAKHRSSGSPPLICTQQIVPRVASCGLGRPTSVGTTRLSSSLQNPCIGTACPHTVSERKCTTYLTQRRAPRGGSGGAVIPPQPSVVQAST